MRIQHNIMAMGAYRNYTNNLSAMKKNLEKLSSGYKINRAGDDAAGLAISEKMRAQITGLETAQKNAKDGISLVQTAEGALTEVHDMLNRMVTLATQSANGTYDNDTDRAQLQKELDQLRTEIDRIADSSNFNGIKLLDGSMSASGVKAVSSQFDLPDVGSILGTDTVLHQDEDEANSSTYFGLEMHNLEFSGAAGDSFTIKIGETELVGTLTGNDTVTGQDIADALTGKDTSRLSFTVDGEALDPSKVTINGEEYEIVDGTHGTTGTGAEGTGVKFNLTSSKSNVDVSFDVSIKSNRAEDAPAPTTPSLKGTLSKTAAAIPSAGGVDGNGRANADATIKEVSSSGRIDKNKVNFALKDSVTDATTGHAIATIVTGTPQTVTQTGTKATYEFKLTDADLAKIQTIIDDMNTATAGDVKDGNITISFNNGGTANEKIELKVGNKVIATADEATLSDTSAITFTGKNATGTTFGQISVTKIDSTWTATDAAGANELQLLTVAKGMTGLGSATISASATDGTANSTSLDTEAITAAALAKNTGAGAVKATYNADAGTVDLTVNGKVIGSATAAQGNITSDLEFFDDKGNSLGVLKFAGNGEIDASKIDDLDTGLSYADAKVNYQLGTVDHDKLAELVKNAITAGNINLGQDDKLDLSYDGTNYNLKLNDYTLGSANALNGSKLEIKNGTDTLVTIDFTNVTALGDLATDTDHSDFSDIGITFSNDEVNKASTDTTGLKAGAANIAKIATELAAKNNVDLSTLDGKALTISYNKDSSEYELKVGDLVLGTDSGTFTAGTGQLSLQFQDENGNNLGGAVTIDNLKSTYTAADFVGEINTDFTFNANKTPAITADFSGLDQDALLKFAEEKGVAKGAKLEAVFDPGSGSQGTWKLQFNDGTNTTEVAAFDVPAPTAPATSTPYDSVTFDGFGTVKFSDTIDKAAMGNVGLDVAKTKYTVDTGVAYGADELPNGIKGDYLVTSSNQKNTDNDGGDRLASTVLNLNKDMVTDGASIFVAGKTYTFSTGKDTVIADGAVKVDISDLDSTKDSYMSDVAKRLTSVYNDDNTGVYTLGWNGKNITVTETMTHGMLKDDGSSVADGTYAADGWDLTTFDGIAKSLGYSTAATKGSSLTLQIGDTAEKFNQLKVDVKDCHAAALGIGDISIADQDSAAAAVDAIKKAINYVSDVRGTLGATQNRLDHTINNLSVMTENIQDAESTIRDTDVAEEMMAYTKNNILIQSAQAMLAQANQVPQGVLQLLG